MLLEIRNIVVHYGGAEILKGVSLEMEQGAITTLIGSNGAGKSTLLRTISGLKCPTSGEILFNGEQINGLPPEAIVRKGICQVPEGRQLFPHMTILESLKIGAFLRKDKREIKNDLEQLYASFPILKDRTHQNAGTLSGGEQQILAMAIALMARPKLLLLDEPSTGLSPKMVTEIGRIIRQIHTGGTSVLLVEQNARMALKLAMRGYVLETGRIVLSGTAKTLNTCDHVKACYLGA